MLLMEYLAEYIAAIENDDWDAAIISSTNAIALYPAKPDPYLMRASVYFAVEDYAAARADAEVVLSLPEEAVSGDDSSWSVAWAWQGASAAAQGNISEAEMFFALAMEHSLPKHWIATIGLSFEELLDIAMPVPTPTPESTLKPLHTGEWVTWEEVQSLGYPEDQGNPPRVLLWGKTRHGGTATLQVDCYQHEGEPLEVWVYVARYSNLVMELPSFEVYTRPVMYTVDGRDSQVVQWEYDTSSADRTEWWFASKHESDVIVEELLQNPKELVVTIEPGEEHAKVLTFSPYGFSEAAKPVLDHCGWEYKES